MFLAAAPRTSRMSSFFFMASAAAEIQRLYPAPSLVKFTLMASKEMSPFWEVLPKVDYEEVREEHTYDGVDKFFHSVLVSRSEANGVTVDEWPGMASSTLTL